MKRVPPGTFPPAFSGVLIADAPGLIKTVMGLPHRPLAAARDVAPTGGWKPSFETPPARTNDHVKHLRLIARALGHDV